MKRLILLPLSLILTAIFIMPIMIESVQALSEINGWISPTESGDHNKYVGYGAHYEPGGIPSVHLGQDFEGNTGDPVYAIADGEVIESRTNVGGYGPSGARGGALVTLFATSDGLQFKVLYGHINNPHPKGAITAGEVLGYMNDYDPPHLHFGIHPGIDYPSDENPWRGFVKETEYAISDDTYGWVDPIDFLETHTPETNVNQATKNAAVTDEPIESQSNSLEQDAICLATAIMSEASVGTNEERVAVAWTIFNRVKSSSFPNSICEVVNQRSQYATNQKPTQEILDLATSLISDRGVDPTAGAVFFFSPISMPKEGEATGGYDIGGGLHEVAGIDDKVYFPSFALINEPTGEIPGVRPEYYMFYRDRATSDQVTLTLYVHDGSADGPVLSGAEVTGQDATGSSFSQTTDANGLVVIMGKPGSWQFTATKTGYAANSWPQEITETCTKHAYILAEEQTTEQASENDIQSISQNAISESNTSLDSELADLLKALKDKDADVRLKAAEALGKLGDAQAVELLIEVLNYDEDSDVRQEAAWALGQIDDPRTIDPLSYASVKDANGYVRDEAYEALQKNAIGGNTKDTRSVDPIIGALKDEDQRVRDRAAQALGQLKNAAATDSLIEALNDENSDVRQEAAWALGQIEDPRTVDPLSYASVKDANGYVREEAYEALQKNDIGGNTVDTRSVDPIIGALKDEDQKVRDRAAQALGQLKNAAATDSLIEALNDENSDVRQEAAWALGEIGDVRSIDPLKYSFVKDVNSYVREEAKKALEKLGVDV